MIDEAFMQCLQQGKGMEKGSKGKQFLENKALEAIQVVETKDVNIDLTQSKNKSKKIIKIISKYKNGPSLAEVLLHADFKDIPILVFSIAGKTRGGKSFLLNLMIKYLESEAGDNWMSGTVPDYFFWKNGVHSVTKGLWIWPKIYKISHKGSKVGILLLDNEGMYDGTVTDGEMIAMSGISTAISYMQMFNVKENITTDYLESVVRSLVKGVQEMDSEDNIDNNLRDEYKLMFVVRDWLYEDDYGYGLSEGELYINETKMAGSDENRLLWQEVSRTFNNIQCLLLPHPGLAVTRKQFSETKNLSDLDPTFLSEAKKFIEALFKPDNLSVPGTYVTGQGIYNILMRADGKIADDRFSFMNVFTDYANFVLVERFKQEFESELSDTLFTGLLAAQSKRLDILTTAEHKLRGNSKSEHLEELTMALEKMMNTKVVKEVVKEYKELLAGLEDVKIHQPTHWPNIRRILQYFLCGDEASRKGALNKSTKEMAKIYYGKLHKELAAKSKKFCGDTEKLELLAGHDHNIVEELKKFSDFGKTAGCHTEVDAIWLKQRLELQEEVTKTLLGRIQTLTKVPLEYLQNARRKQYEYFEAFTLLSKDEGNWDIIPENDETQMLRKKIGFAIFGFPESTDNDQEQGDQPQTGYSADQENIIDPVAKLIVSHSECTIKFSCVFITFHHEDKDVSVPLFRILVKNGIEFVDTNCRVYKEWKDFLSSATLLKDIVFCYPLNGYYNKLHGFNVAFAKSPASKNITKVLKSTDTAGKWVSGIAGVAGVATLAVPAAPIVGGFAIIGGGVAGLYGLCRGIYKIRDKVKHNERVKFKEVLGVVTDSLAVTGMGALKVAQEVALVASQAAKGINFVNGVRTVVFSSNTDPRMITLQNEFTNISLRILFFFNTPSPQEAIEMIQKALDLEDGASTANILEALVQNNSVTSIVETEDNITSKKYVSKNVATIVTGLLKTIVKSEDKLYNISKTLSPENILKIWTLVRTENTHFSSKVWNDVFLKLMNNNSNGFLSALIFVMSTSLTFAVKTNQFVSSMDHKGCTVLGYELEYHPLEEVLLLIRTLVDQNESAVGLALDQDELDGFLKQILVILFETATNDKSQNWNSEKYANCLSIMARQIKKQLKDKFENLKNQTCSDLDSNLMEMIEGGRYGCWLLQQMLQDWEFDEEWEVVSSLSQDWGRVDELFSGYNIQPDASQSIFIQNPNNLQTRRMLNSQGLTNRAFFA